ncbi:hypothetical protein UPYG_G00142710 [Umbra pygmaea]|uniref:Uncharacterized protein n=1 Tax=Umbra pygmaea TaxID=75934 RepID=A0ABD0WX21_UMBPY
MSCSCPIEDERSIREHLRVIKEETEKLGPNIELLQERMGGIKCDRRNFVSNHSTEKTMSEFPCFRLAKMLSVLAPRVLQVSRSPLKDKFSCVIDDCEDGRLKKGLQLEAAIVLLPALFKQDPGLLRPALLTPQHLKWYLKAAGRVIPCSTTTL